MTFYKIANFPNLRNIGTTSGVYIPLVQPVDRSTCPSPIRSSHIARSRRGRAGTQGALPCTQTEKLDHNSTRSTRVMAKTGK